MLKFTIFLKLLKNNTTNMKNLLLTFFLLFSLTMFGQNDKNLDYNKVLGNFSIGVDNYYTVANKVYQIKRKSHFDRSQNMLVVEDYKYISLIGDIEFYFDKKVLSKICYLPKNNRETILILMALYGRPYESEDNYFYNWESHNIEIEFIPYDGITFTKKIDDN